MSTISPTLLSQSVSFAPNISFPIIAEGIVVPVGLQVGREVDLTLLSEVARESILKSSLETVGIAYKFHIAVTYPGAGTETVGVTHCDGFLALRLKLVENEEVLRSAALWDGIAVGCVLPAKRRARPYTLNHI